MRKYLERQETVRNTNEVISTKNDDSAFKLSFREGVTISRSVHVRHKTIA